ncbi:MAG: 50S ribosomal protein L30 [Gammaproteobacteria bacterium]
MADKKIELTLCRSLNGRLKAHQACAHGLGLRKMWQTVQVQDSQENRGMINKISYMLQVKEL